MSANTSQNAESWQKHAKFAQMFLFPSASHRFVLAQNAKIGRKSGCSLFSGPGLGLQVEEADCENEQKRQGKQWASPLAGWMRPWERWRWPCCAADISRGWRLFSHQPGWRFHLCSLCLYNRPFQTGAFLDMLSRVNSSHQHECVRSGTPAPPPHPSSPPGLICSSPHLTLCTCWFFFRLVLVFSLINGSSLSWLLCFPCSADGGRSRSALRFGGSCRRLSGTDGFKQHSDVGKWFSLGKKALGVYVLLSSCFSPIIRFILLKWWRPQETLVLGDGLF